MASRRRRTPGSRHGGAAAAGPCPPSSPLAAGGLHPPPDAIRVGTVGKALPGVELKLAEDGELLVRAATVMRGYRNAPEKTAEAIDADGFLHTGGIATIDDDGYVTIVDRK